jgi:hypothetical protein
MGSFEHKNTYLSRYPRALSNQSYSSFPAPLAPHHPRTGTGLKAKIVWAIWPVLRGALNKVFSTCFTMQLSLQVLNVNFTARKPGTYISRMHMDSSESSTLNMKRI